MYNWQYKDWPKFHYSIDTLPTIAIDFVRKIGEMNDFQWQWMKMLE